MSKPRLQIKEIDCTDKGVDRKGSYSIKRFEVLTVSIFPKMIRRFEKKIYNKA